MNGLAKARQKWAEFAIQIGGEYTCVDDFPGNPFFKITAPLNHWTIRIDSRGYGENNSLGTRMRVSYLSRDALRFSIRKAGIIDHLAAFCGMQDIRIGDDAFDKDFVIRASSEPQVRKLLSCPTIRFLLQLQPGWIHLQAIDQDEECPYLLPTGVDQLVSRHAHFMTDLKDLSGEVKLLSVILGRLVEIGSISERDPRIEY